MKFSKSNTYEGTVINVQLTPDELKIMLSIVSASAITNAATIYKIYYGETELENVEIMNHARKFLEMGRKML